MTQKANILLVDDRDENLIALEAALTSLDQNLVRANSGEEALKHLLGTDFAVILLDVIMPGMDGYETAAHIKQREKTKDVPIIFLTAQEVDRHQVFRGYSSRAVDFLIKPFDPWVLRSKVEVFVELHQLKAQMREQARSLQRVLGQETGEPGRDLAEQLAQRSRQVQSDLASLREHIVDNYQEVDQPLVDAVRRVDRAASRLSTLVDTLHGPEE
ncbi:response regulator [Nocardiopsis terrae]|uniref:Response regulator RpfG family c-di-GMP phosphodiesterase n=1 Tax=Nocardiopsis terrae TaxID=372655 RepID=A0ABR9HM26_9ACTN|nr:response regulator [Nocardiopsis terrae]MBE1460086.1 response regulator RpfG family c-di-GMP phosphodiesterase [Nocardiopsis terrae]GHC69619.1 response regulator [Nocardiopsis terrae]